MLDNGMRLYLSATNDDISITDTVTNKHLMIHNGTVTLDELDKTEVVKCLQGLVGLLCTNTQETKWRMKSSDNCVFRITSVKHCTFKVFYDKEMADVEDGKTVHTRNFDKQKAVNWINRVIASLSKGYNIVLNHSNICRRLSEYGLFVIRHGNHIICTNDDNRCNNVLLNCIVDNQVFTYIYVDLHVDEKLVYFFNGQLNEIFHVPMDDSFLVYFKSDSNVFEED